MTDRHDDALSPAGQSRREAMLARLVDSMGAIHRRRRTRRRALVGSALAIAVVAWWIPAMPTMDEVEPIQVVSAPSTPSRGARDPAPQAMRSARIKTVRTRPDLVARYQPRTDKPALIRHVAASEPVAVEIIGDTLLIEVLAGIDRPAGLVRTEGKVWLTAAVTDADLEAARGAGAVGAPS